MSVQSEQNTCLFGNVTHIGIEHPSALWTLGTTLLSFLAGLGFGLRSYRLREWLRPQNAATTDEQPR